MTVLAVEVDNLTKIYNSRNRSVDAIKLSVYEGEIFGLLGPNGAGKTTTIKMITTLTRPTAGAISVFGVNCLRNPETARAMMGYVPQAVSVDGDLTGYENLLIFSKLFFVNKEVRETRISSALEYMGLTDRAHDLVKQYSGGMMRRLEIAQAMVNRPKMLFLDEPTIGLDPTSRRRVWENIKQMRKEFRTTMFITTHDMNEADELCDRVAIMDRGKIAVLGTPTDLKRTVGREVITLKTRSQIQAKSLPENMGYITSNAPGSLTIATEKGEEAIPKILEYLKKMEIDVASISLSKPTLDDVFMKYTNQRISESEDHRKVRSGRRSFMRHTR